MAARLVPRPGTAVLVGAFVVLLAVVSFGGAEAAPAVVVGSVKCLDCSPADVNAEDAFRGACSCRMHFGVAMGTSSFSQKQSSLFLWVRKHEFLV